jgi:tetratricopeptide (TPR) repeat protein
VWSAFSFVRRKNDLLQGDARPLHYGSALYLASFHILHVPGFALSALSFIVLGALVAEESSSEKGTRLSLPLRADTNKGVAFLVAFVVVSGIFGAASLQGARVVLSDVFVNRAVALYQGSGDLEQASRMVGTALLVFHDNDRAHRAAVELGLLQLNALASEEAGSEAQTRLQETLERTIQHGLSAVSINRANYQNWFALAGLYQNLAGAGIEGAYENAKSAYESAIRENPTNPLPLVRLAQLETVQGASEAALGYLGRALALKPDFATALFLRSQLYAGGGKFTEAREDAGRVVQLAPEDPLGWYNLGVISYTARSFEDAVGALLQAVVLQSNYANALFVLGLSYDELERRDDALRVFESVLALNPKNDTVSSIIANIKAGRPALPSSSGR